MINNSEYFLIIVEDEPKISHLLKDYLKSIFDRIEIISDGAEVLPFVEKNKPDFMILDVMLPGIDGFEICKKIRVNYDFPILFLTARTSELDRILGFDFGADDYVVKPFSPREVLARANAILKRSRGVLEIVDKVNIEKNGILLDPNKHLVIVNGQQLKFTPTEFSILELLMQRPNFVFERQFLVRKVMGYEYEGYERNIDAHIKNIRHKIAQFSDEEKIESVYGVGYKFID